TEIPNMVVLDHIQTEVNEFKKFNLSILSDPSFNYLIVSSLNESKVFLALDSLKKSCASLQAEQYEVALHHAKKAIERAESAFFDPTMVSMLYFPDEHKYAIYMPLFVPISVPLLVAIFREGIKSDLSEFYRYTISRLLK
ncbi:4399_t:CDS:2, partial [Acaulospora colombiana]